MPTNCRNTHPPETDPRFDVPVCGVEIDAETRCAHYATRRDVIAIRFPCCDVFYPCHACHDAVADHPAQQWDAQTDLNERVVLCGACRTVLTWRQYLDAEHACPDCGADFNPGCKSHLHLYITEDAGDSTIPNHAGVSRAQIRAPDLADGQSFRR